ncbi:hypothetical protein THASP1DRAFT_29379 [Thamnocephalis sphaerospora]|uniref:Armadillo-type protein n=1 Tax=Thamnocephalis sphaerospora TaxID=78915 RepID=A0A4P9XRV1_9FUNG|nr:hypothetical protein THASP1DRAFT_29379 [Thamnocephalis sphaerospora]|eukprot:RKP08827.1 hypothetical protein THASP1DRAFT_29379 [Thamnocephalis sphaerospora]
MTELVRATPEGLRGEHRFPYQEALPYAVPADESEQQLSNIKCGLSARLGAGDWAGARKYNRQLEDYMSLKYPLCQEDRVCLAKLLYHVVVQPEVDIAVADCYAQTCADLLRKRHRIESGALTLPWRPLYEKLHAHLSQKRSKWSSPDEGAKSDQIVRLALISQRFFPADATQEILDEFLPPIQIKQHNVAFDAMTWLGRLLPVEPVDGQAVTWLPTMFNLWTTMSRSVEWCEISLDLISRVAETHVTYEAPLFRDTWMDWVFGILLRTCQVPVGVTGPQDSASLYRFGPLNLGMMRKVGASVYGRLIIWSIRTSECDPSDGMPLGIHRLEKLIRALESYFHPSNHGWWAPLLTSILEHTTSQLLRRMRMEADTERYCIPEAARLTAPMRRRIIEALRPAIMLAIFSKDPFSINSAQVAVRYASWIDPAAILPSILGRIVPSLESLTETHRTRSMIQSLTLLARPLLSREHYPAGGKYLSSLLQLTLPGLDPNDPQKCSITAWFIFNVLTGVPLRELGGDALGFIWDGTAMEMTEEDQVVDRAAEDGYCKAATLDMEAWAIQFLARAIAVLESASEKIDHSGGGGHTDASPGWMTYSVITAAQALFAQLSPEQHQVVFGQLLSHARGVVQANAARNLGKLCQAAVDTSPANTLPLVIQLCCDQIREEISYGAGSRGHSEHSDAGLHWYQILLASVLERSGAHALPHRAALLAIFREMAASCRTKRSVTLFAEMLRGFVSGLTTHWTFDCHSENAQMRNNQSYMDEHHMHWHKLDTLTDLKVEWHVPTSEEIDFALELLREFFDTSVDRLTEISAKLCKKGGSERDLVEEAEQRLVILRHFLEGINEMTANDGATMLDDQNDNAGKDCDAMEIDDDDDKEGDAEWDSLRKRMREREDVPRPIVAGYALFDEQDPRLIEYRRMRHKALRMLHQLLSTLLEHRESSVDCVKNALEMTATIIADHGCDSNTYSSMKRRYRTMRAMFALPLGRKLYPRPVLVERLLTYHLRRLFYNLNQAPLLPIHKTLVDDVLRCATSSYSATRKVAQGALSAILRAYPHLVVRAVDKLVDMAVDPDIPESALKGVYYTLQERTLLRCLATSRKNLPRIAEALNIAQRKTKPSVQKQVMRTFTVLSLRRPGRAASVIESSQVRAYAHDLSTAANSLNVDSAWREDANRYAVEYTTRLDKARKATIDALGSTVLSNGFQTLFQAIAIQLLHTMQRPDIPPSADTAKVAVTYLVSDLQGSRLISAILMVRLLCLLKQRQLAKGGHPLKYTITLPSPLPDNFTEQYAHNALDAGKTKEWPLQDKGYVGLHIWPKTMAVYRSGDEAQYPAAVDTESDACRETLRDAFRSPEFWERVSKFAAEERSRGGEERFTQRVALLYKLAAEQFGVSVLDAALPVVTKLCQTTDENRYQRAAAELVAGLIAGSKHWPSTSRARLWDALLPLLRQAIDNSTPETLPHWDKCIGFCCHNRDPRRILPLVHLLLRDVRFDSDSSSVFAELRMITLARTLLSTGSWTLRMHTQQLLAQMADNIQHPYEQVRNEIGRTIHELLRLHISKPFASSAARLAHDREDGGSMSEPQEDGNDCRAIMDGILVHLNSWHAERRPVAAGASDYTNASKTGKCQLTGASTVLEPVLQWLSSGARQLGGHSMLPCILQALPELFRMQDINDDRDLQARATSVLRYVVNYPYPPAMTPRVANVLLCIISESKSWHIRGRVLPLLQVFFFNQLFMLDRQQTGQMMERIVAVLRDSQLEVRVAAAGTLSGLIRCSERETINTLQVRCIELLDEHQVKRRRKRDRANPAPTSSADEDEAARVLLQRHAGVLGLVSMVMAFPYEVPAWMPEIMLRLSHCLADPEPVRSTVRKAFSDFKRTHQDTWHEDSRKFSEDQLEQLMDLLVSPSYYA